MMLAYLGLHSDRYGHDESTIANLFYLLLVFGLLLFIIICLVIPISAAKRFSKVIKALNITETSIAGSTCKVAWIQGQNFEVNRQSIKCADYPEISYGSGLKPGIIIKLGNEEYYLIEEFINEFDVVKKLLQ